MAGYRPLGSPLLSGACGGQQSTYAPHSPDHPTIPSPRSWMPRGHRSVTVECTSCRALYPPPAKVSACPNCGSLNRSPAPPVLRAALARLAKAASRALSKLAGRMASSDSP